ncbi:MAG: NAD(P)/FAD-dependent oxidoreductase [Candidatus Omnitrophica bacterium]|nr:NAD(P)/FAD-dependent oxidoreductase [Candidatus Omnitrophota bacterium]
METYDVVVIGAGAAGMMCAIQAGRRGRRVALLEHAGVIGQKIRISGGGRCNFTNRGATPERYVSENPDFCRSALARYTAEDFVELVRAHGIAFHEKTLGQLFCDGSAQQIIDMLIEECRRARVTIALNCQVQTVKKADGFLIKTSAGDYAAESLVIATGGLSLPKTGATHFGYRIAEQFGLRVVPTSAALDAFVFSENDRRRFEELAGVSLPAAVTCHGARFEEGILFTHTGLSGPAALQASLYWQPGRKVSVDLLPSMSTDELRSWLAQKKTDGSGAKVETLLAERLPRRVVDRFCRLHNLTPRSLAQQPAAALESLCRGLKAWTFMPRGTAGYGTAEVTRGGVDTKALSSKTMECHTVPGLYFIGEVVDVTGWLGGYNFQWAWSSGWAAGQAV